jgi:hypothetical protein
MAFAMGGASPGEQLVHVRAAMASATDSAAGAVDPIRATRASFAAEIEAQKVDEAKLLQEFSAMLQGNVWLSQGVCAAL